MKHGDLATRNAEKITQTHLYRNMAGSFAGDAGLMDSHLLGSSNPIVSTKSFLSDEGEPKD